MTVQADTLTQYFIGTLLTRLFHEIDYHLRMERISRGESRIQELRETLDADF